MVSIGLQVDDLQIFVRKMKKNGSAHWQQKETSENKTKNKIALKAILHQENYHFFQTFL